MICLAAGAITAALALSEFTLAWQHSIEKTRWEEDWHVTGAVLALEAARIAGSGAGMEPPVGAELRDGIWHYRPLLHSVGVMRVTHSPYAPGYELCVKKVCIPLADYLPGIENEVVIELKPCQQ